MPARIVVVHVQTDFLGAALIALRGAGYDAIGFSSTYLALDVFDTDQDIELLVTGLSFGSGKQTGRSLALMEKTRRLHLKILFADAPEHQDQSDGIGEFLPLPITGSELVNAVQNLLSGDGTGNAAHVPSGLLSLAWPPRN